MSESSYRSLEDLPRSGTSGCWTGLIADMQMLKSLTQRTMPEYYLEQYPKHRARALNTWLARFGMYTNGTFFELDRKGSALVKELIKRSKKNSGFLVRVNGVRKGNKIKVQSALEITRPEANSPLVNERHPEWLRHQFTKMGV